MLPLTVKQQKFSKLSAKMNPELMAIQKKYKNKKDQDVYKRQQLKNLGQIHNLRLVVDQSKHDYPEGDVYKRQSSPQGYHCTGLYACCRR